MKFIHKDNKIIIGNVVLTLQQFKTLEPMYQDLPSGYNVRIYNPGIVHEISGDKRMVLQEPKIWSEGDRYLRRIKDFENLKKLIDAENESVTQNVSKEIKKRKSYKEKRNEEYPLVDAMVIALWERLVEKRSEEESGIKHIQQKREDIKKKYPKK